MKINILLNRSKADIENLKKNTQKVVLPKGAKKKVKEHLELLNLYPELLTKIRDVAFTKDIEFKDIGVKKSIKSVFEEPKYKKVLDDYLVEKEKLKNKSTKDAINFECYKGLDEDIGKLEEIFDMAIEGLQLIEKDIKEENFASVEVVCDVSVIISRLGQLYNLYGYYLEDIGGLAEFTVTRITFQGVIQNLEELFQELEKGV